MTATTAVPPMTTPSSAPRYGRSPAACMALAALPLLLAACGGGGGDGSGDPVVPPGPGVTVGGTVSGLGEGRSLILQNKGADDTTVAANGSFVMSRRIVAPEVATITVALQPEAQRCTVTNGQRGVSMSGGNVTDVAVRCENLPAGTHNVSGQVTGLVPGGKLVLQNNQGDNVTLNADGRFLFNTAVAAGADYAVRVQTQPVGQNCTVANASGTVGNTDVRSVQVACAGVPQAFPEGAWVGDYCGPGASNPSYLSHLNISRTGEGRAAFSQGRVFFDNNFLCGGAGRVVYDDAQQGTMVVDRQESRGSLTAFWGVQTDHAGSQRVVWARKGPYLCLLPKATLIYPKANPTTEYPTLDIVEKDTDEAITIKGCHRASSY